jgi:hypothetical protein
MIYDGGNTHTTGPGLLLRKSRLFGKSENFICHKETFLHPQGHILFIKNTVKLEVKTRKL